MFFGIPLKKFQLFSISSQIGSGRIPLLYDFIEKEGAPLVFWLVFYFKKVLTGDYNIITLFLSITLFLLSILALFTLSFMFIQIFNKLSYSRIILFQKIDSFFETMINIKTIYILIFLFLISFILRLNYLDPELLHHDSVQYAIATEKTLENGKLEPVVGERYGLVIINVVGYFIPYFIFGIKSSEFVINIITVLFASFSVVVLYLFTQEFLNNRHISISAALLFSLNPIFLSVTTYTKDHSHSIFFIILAAYSLLKLIKTNSSLFKILFGLSMGILLFVRPSDIIVIIPLFGVYLLPNKFIEEDNSIKLNKRFGVRNLLLVLIPFLIFLSVYLSLYINNFFELGHSNRFLNPFPDLFDIFLITAIASTSLGSFLMVYGLFYILNRKKYSAILFLIWFLSILIFYSSFYSTKLRFLVTLVIPSSILMAYGLNVIKQKFRLLSPLFLILVLVIMFIFVKPALAFRHNYSSGKEVVKYVENLTENNSLVFDWGDDVIFYDYYVKRNVNSCPYISKEEEFKAKIELINEALESNKSVYISDKCFLYGKKEELEKTVRALNENYDFKLVGKVYSENYEDIIVLRGQEFGIYQLRKKLNKN